MNAIAPLSPTSLPMNGRIQGSALLPQRFQMIRTEAAGTNDGAKVKLQTFGRPIPELLSFAQNMFNMMEGNAYFPEPQPPQDEFGALVAEAKAATAKASQLKTLFAAAITGRDEAITRLKAAMDKRGSYVQGASMGIANRIYSAGVGVRNARQKVGPLEPPTGLLVEVGQAHGTMTLTWDKVKKARGYMLEYGPVDGPTVQKTLVGLRNLKLSDLTVGTLYQFRIAAIGGSEGQSAWSPWAKRAAA